MPRRGSRGSPAPSRAISYGLRPASTSSSSSSLRLGGERARELQPLAAGDGQAGGGLVEHAARGRRAVATPSRRRSASARARRAEVRADRDVLAHGLRGERLRDLEGARDAAPREPVRRLAGDVGAVEGDAAASACRKPEMSANSVVLPAPLGPISAVMRPASAVNEASLTARRPPKRRETFSTRSSSCRAPLPAPHAANSAGDAARHEHHDQNQHAAVDHDVEARRSPVTQLGRLRRASAAPARRAADPTACPCRRRSAPPAPRPRSPGRRRCRDRGTGTTARRSSRPPP